MLLNIYLISTGYFCVQVFTEHKALLCNYINMQREYDEKRFIDALVMSLMSSAIDV